MVAQCPRSKKIGVESADTSLLRKDLCRSREAQLSAGVIGARGESNEASQRPLVVGADSPSLRSVLVIVLLRIGRALSRAASHLSHLCNAVSRPTLEQLDLVRTAAASAELELQLSKGARQKFSPQSCLGGPPLLVWPTRPRGQARSFLGATCPLSCPWPPRGCPARVVSVDTVRPSPQNGGLAPRDLVPARLVDWRTGASGDGQR